MATTLRDQADEGRQRLPRLPQEEVIGDRLRRLAFWTSTQEQPPEAGVLGSATARRGLAAGEGVLFDKAINLGPITDNEYLKKKYLAYSRDPEVAGTGRQGGYDGHRGDG